MGMEKEHCKGCYTAMSGMDSFLIFLLRRAGTYNNYWPGFVSWNEKVLICYCAFSSCMWGFIAQDSGPGVCGDSLHIFCL